jgi:hypothetical protein
MDRHAHRGIRPARPRGPRVLERDADRALSPGPGVDVHQWRGRGGCREPAVGRHAARARDLARPDARSGHRCGGYDGGPDQDQGAGICRAGPPAVP